MFAVYTKVADGLRAQVAALEAEQKELRELLWLRHGCGVAGLYGDDGEMQCSAHHPSIDFKRMALADITRGISLHIAKAKEKAEADRDRYKAMVDKARIVLTLHSPIRYGQGQTFICDWCGEVWEGVGGRAENPHPANGCLVSDLEAQR